MIFGHITVDGQAVVTHRDSYLIDKLSVVSVRRPFFLTGLLFGGAFIGFTAAFGDLLYPVEIGVTLGLSLSVPVVLSQVGQLKLLSRDLRGSDLAGVVWGRYASLNRIRREIVATLLARRAGVAS
jgi:hypothetical protein